MLKLTLNEELRKVVFKHLFQNYNILLNDILFVCLFVG